MKSRSWDQICRGKKKNVSDKNFGKITIKFKMRIKQCTPTPAPNFSQFGERQFLRPNLPKKDFRAEYQDKLNLRITYLSKKKL